MTTNKIYVFDAYGTLFRVNSDIPGLTKKAKVIVNNIQELWRTRQLEYTWLNSLMGHWMHFNQITEDALDFAMEFYNVRDEDLRQKLLDIYKSPSTFDDVEPFLSRAVKGNSKTAILSNGVRDTLEMSVEFTHLEDLVQGVLSAEKVQKYKPSPDVYGMVTDLFGCDPQEVTFFSSNAWDIAGARKFGFHTVWVNRKDVPFEGLAFSPDMEVSTLLEFGG